MIEARAKSAFVALQNISNEKEILFATANGTGSPGEGDPPVGPGNAPPEGKLGESVVRAQVDSEGKIKAKEFFSPFNSAELDKEDFDIGSAGPIAMEPMNSDRWSSVMPAM